MVMKSCTVQESNMEMQMHCHDDHALLTGVHFMMPQHSGRCDDKNYTPEA